MLLGTDHPSRVVPRLTHVCIPDTAHYGTGIDTTDGLVLGAHWGYSTHHTERDQAAWRAICMQISASHPVYIDKVSGILAQVPRRDHHV